jgi:peroxiredoxin
MKDAITRSGATLVYVAAQKREGFFRPEKYLSEHPLSFPLLLDEDRSVTKAYGVYHRVGLDAYDIARPATFVVAADGTINYIFVASSQSERAPVDDVLAAVKRALAKAQ